jgi:hypothetical protein
MACALKPIRQPFWRLLLGRCGEGLGLNTQIPHHVEMQKQNSEVDIYVPLCHTPLLNRVYICVISVCFLFILKRVLFCPNYRL